METRHEKDSYDMAIPQFKSDYCENCHNESTDLIELNHHVYGRVHVVVPFMVCEGCIKEVIEVRCRCRNVSDMTEELKTK